MNSVEQYSCRLLVGVLGDQFPTYRQFQDQLAQFPDTIGFLLAITVPASGGVGEHRRGPEVEVVGDDLVHDYAPPPFSACCRISLSWLRKRAMAFCCRWYSCNNSSGSWLICSPTWGFLISIL